MKTHIKTTVITGCRGSGKTTSSIEKALDILQGQNQFTKIVFLDVFDKSCYKYVFAQKLGHNHALDILVRTGAVEFATPESLRGRTLDGCIVVIDDIDTKSIRTIDRLAPMLYGDVWVITTASLPQPKPLEFNYECNFI